MASENKQKKKSKGCTVAAILSANISVYILFDTKGWKP